MKVTSSRLIEQKKPILKQLLDRLLQTYSYASILMTDSKGKQYTISKQGISITENMFVELGYVVKVYVNFPTTFTTYPNSTNMFSVMLIPCFEMVYCLPFESVIRMDAYEYVCSNLSNNCFRIGFFCSISLLDVTFIPFPFTFQVFVVLIDYLSIGNGIWFVNRFRISGKVSAVRRKKRPHRMFFPLCEVLM